MERGARLTKICHPDRSIAISLINRNAEWRDLLCGSPNYKWQNESAPDSIWSHETLVRAALPRSLLTTNLHSDLRFGNGSDVLLTGSLVSAILSFGKPSPSLICTDTLIATD
jgi:hypothetical protein